jgi:hypothetical protein
LLILSAEFPKKAVFFRTLIQILQEEVKITGDRCELKWIGGVKFFTPGRIAKPIIKEKEEH